MPFSKISQILFIVGSTFLIFHFGVPQQFMVVFLEVILRFWRPKKSFPSIPYLFSQRFMVLACCHPLIIVFIVSILFTYPEHFLSFFHFFTPKAIVLQILSVHHSSILLSTHDLFVLMFLNPLKYPGSFSNSYRRFIPFTSCIFNFTGGPSKILLPSL